MRSAFLFPTKKQEAVTESGSSGIDHLARRKTRESVPSKGGRTSDTAVHSIYIYVNKK